jgi:hypothetical protein
MKRNIAFTDRVIRVIIAGIFITLYFANLAKGVWGMVFLSLGSLLAITSLINFCPLYSMLGINTHKKNS